jgi:hypothetical protein
MFAPVLVTVKPVKPVLHAQAVYIVRPDNLLRLLKMYYHLKLFGS